MKYSTHVKPISYLKNHAAEIAATLADTREPMLITQNGEARLVVMGVEAWEQQEQTLALLKLLALGNRQIEAGQFTPADAVFAALEADGE
ncbi:type II toxin-antitoxin system Phd/YefM family antitoxin [Thermomonas sp.]|uniref:type II toxin-antitoxin system Phd/YefM family antitoxin n=1 Tax=Thermomonas sp. TaxID=1971895 RepID=UPI002487EBC1|nr:type II toxin-antitoxin system Phd/YefM family antitoxin [Thermomonas sp.]MDI1254094.1 type II toxin-antitoxin system Phd/YefM family antitoxin [Thermomonas sp.]